MKLRFLIAVLLLLVPIGAFAQGVQTATLQGNVTDASGAALPGVTVTAKSPGLQGERTAYTTSTGEYVLRGLPPGDYTVTFALEGMATRTVTKSLPLGLTTVIDSKMTVAAVTAAITVTASAPTVLESQTVGANIKDTTVQQLPILRTPVEIGQLSPGVTGDRGGRATTPVGGQLSINGGMAYDNNFMINGVNFQDNIFGNTNNLFIEDAIQETQVLTSGISAEYGHFTGGVLNVITKSGGNQFTGSLRDDLSKPGWLGLTPYEQGFRGNGVTPAAVAPHRGKLSNIYEATLGGPVWKDHLWFFLAGRKELSNTAGQVAGTGQSYTVATSNKRPEVKLTGTLFNNQTFQADWLNNPVSRNLEVQVSPLDINAIGTNSVRENSGYSVFYNGVITNALFAEARYAKKHFGFRGLGGTLRDIQDSPFYNIFSGQLCCTFNAPYFDATDPEDRNNHQVFAALSYFLSRPTLGSHDIKGGVEQFVDERTGGNSQSATNYVFYSGYQTGAGGQPVLDSSGHLIPVFQPCDGSTPDCTLNALYLATRGAKLDITTDSFFINDRWTLNQNFSFNLGGRYERTKSRSTGQVSPPINTSNVVPRLGASYDPLANGKFKFDVTYAGYVGRYAPTLTGANSVVGNPAGLYGYYVGPVGSGKNFAPGFDPKNYVIYGANVPTANIFVDPKMHAPIVKEWTASFGTALTPKSWLKATVTDRKYTDFVQAFVTLATGSTDVVLNGTDAGVFDNILYANSNLPKRHYQASELQAHYDVFRNWSVEGNWTHQFKNNGNYEGESGQSIGTAALGQRPEMTDPREFPTGRLAQYEANRVRLWTIYNFGLGRLGDLSTGFVYRYDSPLTFSYSATVNRSAQSKAANPGYKSPSTQVTMFYGDRGAGQFNASSLIDASLQYSFPIVRVTPWIKFDVRNVFNSKTLILWNTGVTPDAASPKDTLGYNTGFVKRAAFGRPTSTTSYVRPREYLVYAGVRF